MKEICPRNKCTGCGACVNSCTHSAVTLQPDPCGYMYPIINQDACVDCGLCQMSCPSVKLQTLRYPLQSLAVTCKTEEETLSCASGGAATLLSGTIIKSGGVVYGCDGTDIRNVHHVRIDTIEGLERLKGSKYVQSFIGDAYIQVKKDLKNGIKVLFIGTPCQVAGLHGFLRGKTYDNLFTADLVCHGVASQKMLNDNIDLYSQNQGDECRLKFREKIAQGVTSKRDASYRITYGWFFQNHPYVKAETQIPYHKDPYMLGFISGLTFRPNCYECRYACIARVSDLTLSDYWGLSTDAGFDKGKGVSNILVNTQQGQRLWEMAKTSTIFKERDIIEALRGNGQLQAPSPRHPEHNVFEDLYPRIGFRNAVSKCSKKYLLRLHMKKLLSDFRKFINI